MLCTSGFVDDVMFSQCSEWARIKGDAFVSLSSPGSCIRAKSTVSDSIFYQVDVISCCVVTLFFVVVKFSCKYIFLVPCDCTSLFRIVFIHVVF